MLAITIRVIMQMKNNKRLLAVVLLAPILILTFTRLLFSEPVYNLSIATVNMPESVNKALETQFEWVMGINDSPDNILRNKVVDAVLSMNGSTMELKMYENDADKSAQTTKLVMTALQIMEPNSQRLEISYLYGDPGKSRFYSMGHIFLGLFSFMFVFLMASAAFAKERASGTMERLMLAPVARWEIVAGFIMGFGSVAVVQSVLVVFFSKYILGLEILGSFWAAIVITILLAIVAVSLSLTVSIFTNKEYQTVLFMPAVIVTQVFFSGIIPVDTIPYHLDKLAYFMPVYYACAGLDEVMAKGTGFSRAMLYYCDALLLLAVILFVINVMLLKKYRKV